MTALLICVDWPEGEEWTIEGVALVRSGVEQWGTRLDFLPVTIMAKAGSIAEMRKHLNESAPKTRKKGGK